MNRSQDDLIRQLAEPLWESASRPYGMALDFWLMAEQMVQEMFSAAIRMQTAIVESPPPIVSYWMPEAVPVSRIQALAECMWESAGRQYGMTQDFWLAAERHVQAMLRALAVPPGMAGPYAWAREMAALPPKAYLEQIRTLAYQMWEQAGHQYGQTLEYWLKAEQFVLTAMMTLGSATRETGSESDPVQGAATAPPPPELRAEPSSARGTKPAGRAGTDGPVRKRKRPTP